MGKLKARPKRLTSVALRRRKILSLRFRSEGTEEQDERHILDQHSKSSSQSPSSNPSCDNVRIIFDIKSLQILINEVSAHNSTCTNIPNVKENDWKNVQLYCTNCQYFKNILKDVEAEHELPLNESLVVGAYSAGIGYTGLRAIFSCMELPFIHKQTYIKYETTVGIKLQAKVDLEFQRVADLERSLAEEDGRTLKLETKTYPLLTVIVDGGWPKRGYGHSYDSNAGVGVIIGERTGKVLYMGSRIKTCKMCSTSPGKTHKCYKNHSGSAHSMESSIILEGFRECFEKYSLIFRYMVGDADSSVFSNIQTNMNYPNRIPVEKIDCCNHAVRGLNSKVHAILKGSGYSKSEVQMITINQNRYTNLLSCLCNTYTMRKLFIVLVFYYRFGKDIRAAISYNSKNIKNGTSAVTLAEDIVNIPSHIFGQHTKCKPYFCKGGGQNQFAEFSKSKAGQEILKSFHLLSNRSYKLIADTTSNRAESFMSLMNKITSGKRVNYAQRGGYRHRCCAAVFAYNYGGFWPAKVFSRSNTNPCAVWSQAESYFDSCKKRSLKPKPKRGPFGKRKNTDANSEAYDYGPNATKGYMTSEEIETQVKLLVERLQVTLEQRDQIQIETIGQSVKEEWKIQRRNRLTASNAGTVYKLRDSTKNEATLKKILYPIDLSFNEHIKRGINLEPIAKSVYSLTQGHEIKECGLFVWRENGILAASPDALVGDNGILEIKCPQCKPMEEPLRKTSFLEFADDENTQLRLKRTHLYYYQILMQIYVAEKDFCDFFVFHQPCLEDTYDFFCERISRDTTTDTTWKLMKAKLVKFYMMDMAPEIVDPIFSRFHKFRVPEYRRIAMDESELRKQKKLATS